MPSTTWLSLPYPAASAQPDVAGDIYALANAIDGNSAALATTSFGSGFSARTGFLTLTRRLPGGQVLCTFALQKSSSITNTDIPLTLPVNYRPGAIVPFPATFLDDSTGTWATSAVPALVNTNGTVTLTSVPGTVQNVFGTVSFFAA